MTSKMAKAAMVSAHAAGIFADMTVDGPVIGDLVVAIDRAKNLPNRKTMGKQDPYCAARLGKEAQKTPTDRRGGQTPKWDHEMRFTVHDSPDYYKLKISVFNDDKKTDLIGETWVNLEDIVVRGGGETEGWHKLNCKGRFAGEIWIELTYWDTRPREEKVSISPSSSTTSLRHERSADAVGGPRGPKPVKRRPLPADPTSASSSSLRPSMPEHTQSAPVPSTPAKGASRLHGPSPHSAGNSSRQISQPIAAPSSTYIPSTLPKSYNTPQLDHYENPNYHQHEEHHLSNSYPTYEDPYDPQYNIHETGNESSFQDGNIPRDQYKQEPQYGNLDLPELPPHTPRNSRPSAQPSPKYYTHQTPESSPVYELPNYGASPEIPDQDDRRSGSGAGSRQSRNDQHTRNPSFDDYSKNAILPTIEDDGPPPPPPAHRSSFGARDTSPGQQYVPPLNARGSRGSFNASPLAHNIEEAPHESYVHSASTEEPRFEQPRRLSQLDPELHFPTQPYSQTSPKRFQAYTPESSRQNDRQDFRRSMGSQPYTTPPYRGRQSVIEPHYEGPMEPSDDRLYEQYNDPRAHHSPAPIIKPRAISPSPPKQTGAPGTIRKSVSPRPAPGPAEDGLSGVPFSPDSFDQLNPNLKPTQSNQNYGDIYDGRHREKEHETAKGPIIDHTGKVVDPSDYLPTDTWAPELQRKVARPSHEIKLRFKHSPGGAQPMPASASRAPREPVVRPHSIATAPVQVSHSYSTEETSPTHGRNRLQKKSRGQHDSYNSPHVVPTMQGHNAHGASYPLREHPNYGHGNSPSSYYRGSAGGGPPPIPAKVPFGGGQEDWDDRLSEEIRGIDIGIGSGGRRRGDGGQSMGTSRYGG